MSSLAPSSQARSMVTPVKQTPPAVRESPGNWKHPRLAEITRRQSKTTFNEKNIRQIVYNIGALGLVAVIRKLLLPIWPKIVTSAGLREYGGWLFTLLFLFPLFNIGLALLPLVRPADDLSDIPLTPSQRKLLGLPPSAKPATPGSAYSTPPRYSRTPSIGGSPASLRSHMSNSPLSASEQRRTASAHSPYSPSAPSPLFHKVVGGGTASGLRERRSSFGNSGFGGSSTLGASTSSSLFESTSSGPGTPTPANGKRSSVSLNNKWLYEKGRRASSNSFLNSSLGP
ncbi:Nuclear pore complex component domain containing protein [Naviculisporaceae sp. PSN 640]